MASLIKEREFQEFFLEKLEENGYRIVKPKEVYDKAYAINKPELFEFLNTTQPKEMTALRKIYKDKLEETIINTIRTEETKKNGSRLDIFNRGINISNISLKLMYGKPATLYNETLNKLYDQNIFSAAEEVYISEKERIDVVTFLNGLATFTFELKSNPSGQSYEDAIYQYRIQRNKNNPLLKFKSGALVHFAMDMQEVHMTTHLDGDSTIFLPFNKGKGEGIEMGAGNPEATDEEVYDTHYMWDDVLTKDSVIEIISKFMFVQVERKTNELTGKTKVIESVIFPRYHQRDVILKTREDVLVNRTSQNYLIQHSAGSGKTHEITWLAYDLAQLHDENNQIIFDNIVVCTDRVVVDRQLQNAVSNYNHKSGYIRVMDDKCTAQDLRKALEGNTKIVVTTIQKFPYITENILQLKKKKFAVIIDEAHSSTAGKNMASLTSVLSNVTIGEDPDLEDKIIEEILKKGKQLNTAMFAFTATPKSTTLELFGRTGLSGKKEPFHVYSMKQAIEEGFILDVLENYTTYENYYEINKLIKDDPMYQTAEAKRQIARYAELHETNIAQRVEIIIKHFQNFVAGELNGMAKAMIVTESRLAALKYKKAIDDYLKRNKIDDIHTLVAFSGKLVDENGNEYTERSINNISEKKLPEEFDTDNYQLLIVADKYQTGFDQKKLCAMYILKSLHGVATVQTLSRLNRICPPFEKKTFVLDFVNTYESVLEDFSTYYTTTILSHSVKPENIYRIEARLDSYNVLESDDIEKFANLLHLSEMKSSDRQKMNKLLQRAQKKVEVNPLRPEIYSTINSFIRLYEFLLQATCFEDVQLHKKYDFLSYLKSYLKINKPGNGFNLKDKVKISNFVQNKTSEHTKTKIKANPYVSHTEADQIILTGERQDKLSKIIEEMNYNKNKNYQPDAITQSMSKIVNLMKNSEDLKKSAKNNSYEDFDFPLYDAIEDTLIDGMNKEEEFYTQSRDFMNTLLSDKELAKSIFEIYKPEIYNELRR